MIRMFVGSALFAAIAALGSSHGSVWAQSPYPNPFDREGATRLLENDRVIVWENVWKKGRSYPLHEHRYDMTGIFTAWGRVKVTLENGRESGANARPFEIPTGFFTLKGVIHKEETLGDEERRGIMVELKDPNPSPLPPRPGAEPAFPREGAKQVFDSERSVIWDVTLPVGAGRPYYHPYDSVDVFLNGGTIKTTGADGKSLTVARKPNEVRFSPRGRVDTDEAIETPVRMVVIELK